MFTLACNEKPSELTKIPKGPDNYDPNLAWSNSNNPYDTIGDFHNQGLDYCLNFSEYFQCSDSILFRDQIIEQTSDFCCSLGWYTPEDSCSYYCEDYALNAILFRQEYTITEMIEYSAIDNDSKNEMLDLISIVEENTDSNNINLLYNAIKGWESDVINSNYSVGCKKQLLGSSSVLRYSLHYWNTQRLLGEESLWILPCDVSKMGYKNGRIQNWFTDVIDFVCDNWDGILVTAVADADGFYYGAGLDKQPQQEPNWLGGVICGVALSVATAEAWPWK